MAKPFTARAPGRSSAKAPTKVVAESFKDTASTPFTGEDIRFTTNGKTIYAVGGLAKWATDSADLHVQLPPGKPPDYAAALRIR
jgi:hypothetical protein